MSDTTKQAATSELVIERTFDAPRELVWKAFTDPDQISQWFGPVGYSVPARRLTSTFGSVDTSG